MRSSEEPPRKAASVPPQPPSGAPAAPTCMLLVGDRVVLRASSPPEAEYALFDIGEIELRASEPGRVREHGYQTTAERARTRLVQLGITPALARECGLAMQPTLTEAYARGSAARRIARHLGPLELLQSDVYEPASQTYRGVFIDLPTLVRDLDMAPPSHASATLQALHLAALLDAAAPDTAVFLSTAPWTSNLKPGERTHKRPLLVDPRKIASALAKLARLEPVPEVHEQLAQTDVLAFLRARSEAAPDEDGRALYRSLERTISAREMPSRGPLSDPELWALDVRIDAGRLDGVLVTVDELERRRGRTPGTTYIRARATLALELEPSRLVAERISALALSMTSFQELSLLAAEAWLDAGDARRALPYARDLVDAPGVDEGLLLRAQGVLARAVGAAPDDERRSRTYADGVSAPMPPSASVPAPELLEPAPRLSSRRPERPKPAVAEVVLPSARPPPLDLELTPPPMTSEAPAASFAFEPAPPPAKPTRPPAPRRSEVPAGGRRGAVSLETRPPAGLDPRAEPESWPNLAAAKPPSFDEERSIMCGASLPPYRTERPAPLLPTAPLLPRTEGTGDDLAEHLALPPGVGEALARSRIPRSVLEARVEFTMLARELGREYRVSRGIELRADVRGIEAMQAVLLECVPDEDGLRRHGALLSEILARRLAADWLDITPEDLGHWAMIIPPDTRVWPFGRVARLVAMGPRTSQGERHLVDYFRELESRARLR